MFVLNYNNAHYWIFSSIANMVPPYPARPANEEIREIMEAVHYVIDINTRGYYPPGPSVEAGLSKIICEALKHNRVDVVKSIRGFADYILNEDELFTACAFQSGEVEPVKLVVSVIGDYGLDYIQNYITYNPVSWNIIDYLYDRLDVDSLMYDLDYLIRTGMANEYQTQLHQYLSEMDITNQIRRFRF